MRPRNVLIRNDLSTTSSCFFSSSYKAARVVVEVVFATVDHSDIRGSKPHNRDPSGAASDYKRGFGPKA